MASKLAFFLKSAAAKVLALALAGCIWLPTADLLFQSDLGPGSRPWSAP